MSNEPLLPDKRHIPTVTRENTPSRDATVVSTRDHQVIREWAVQVELATGEATSSGAATTMKVRISGQACDSTFLVWVVFREI